jgi:hypothetical protein
MTDAQDTDVYKATAYRSDGEQNVRKFEQLSQAIVWVAAEVDAGDGFTIYGEVVFKDNVLWRRGTRPAQGG